MTESDLNIATLQIRASVNAKVVTIEMSLFQKGTQLKRYKNQTPWTFHKISTNPRMWGSHKQNIWKFCISGVQGITKGGRSVSKLLLVASREGGIMVLRFWK